MGNVGVTLVKAIFGMGNLNHTHMHRHNTLELNSSQLDAIKFEQMSGGVSAQMINDVSMTSGGVSAAPQGQVNVEDGWNVRRGIGMLTFEVSQSSIESRELTILGYLFGGNTSAAGIDTETIFVPQRSWTIAARQLINPGLGLPEVHRAVVESNQFLMGDPDHVKKMKSIRPLDISSEILGKMSIDEESNHSPYEGSAESDLTRHLVMSKTNNLNTTHHARELIKLAAGGMKNASSFGDASLGVADAMMAPSLNEISPSHNEFMLAMQGGLGSIGWAGFQGYSIGDIAMVFETFQDVYDMHLMDEITYPDAENILTAHQYGTITAPEILSVELAMLTVHLLMSVGLQFVEFSATNNPHHLGGLNDGGQGFQFMAGKFLSVMDSDERPIARVQEFERMLGQSFFSKYTANPYAPNSTLVSVHVEAFLFGETKVTVEVNDGAPFTFVNATYMIARTSTNIAGREFGLSESTAILENLRSHFE